jgi:hypothetical protein
MFIPIWVQCLILMLIMLSIFAGMIILKKLTLELKGKYNERIRALRNDTDRYVERIERLQDALNHAQQREAIPTRRPTVARDQIGIDVNGDHEEMLEVMEKRETIFQIFSKLVLLQQQGKSNKYVDSVINKYRKNTVVNTPLPIPFITDHMMQIALANQLTFGRSIHDSFYGIGGVFGR